MIYFFIGIILGFIWGCFSSYKYYEHKTPIKHIIVKMTAKEAADFIDSNELVEQLKKEMKL